MLKEKQKLAWKAFPTGFSFDVYTRPESTEREHHWVIGIACLNVFIIILHNKKNPWH